MFLLILKNIYCWFGHSTGSIIQREFGYLSSDLISEFYISFYQNLTEPWVFQSVSQYTYCDAVIILWTAGQISRYLINKEFVRALLSLCLTHSDPNHDLGLSDRIQSHCLTSRAQTSSCPTFFLFLNLSLLLSVRPSKGKWHAFRKGTIKQRGGNLFLIALHCSCLLTYRELSNPSCFEALSGMMYIIFPYPSGSFPLPKACSLLTI